jgi:hypothetical protein
VALATTTPSMMAENTHDRAKPMVVKGDLLVVTVSQYMSPYANLTCPPFIVHMMKARVMN